MTSVRKEGEGSEKNSKTGSGSEGGKQLGKKDRPIFGNKKQGDQDLTLWWSIEGAWTRAGKNQKKKKKSELSLRNESAITRNLAEGRFREKGPPKKLMAAAVYNGGGRFRKKGPRDENGKNWTARLACSLLVYPTCCPGEGTVKRKKRLERGRRIKILPFGVGRGRRGRTGRQNLQDGKRTLPSNMPPSLRNSLTKPKRPLKREKGGSNPLKKEKEVWRKGKRETICLKKTQSSHQHNEEKNNGLYEVEEKAK